MTEEDLSKLGAPVETKQIWETVISAISEHITTICFTQNPNDMPMWAHYANEHQGFCVEYEIINNSNFYPVIYVDNRLKSISLFIELFYALLDENICFVSTGAPNLDKSSSVINTYFPSKGSLKLEAIDPNTHFSLKLKGFVLNMKL